MLFFNHLWEPSRFLASAASAAALVLSDALLISQWTAFMLLAVRAIVLYTEVAIGMKLQQMWPWGKNLTTLYI